MNDTPADKDAFGWLVKMHFRPIEILALFPPSIRQFLKENRSDIETVFDHAAKRVDRESVSIGVSRENSWPLLVDFLIEILPKGRYDRGTVDVLKAIHSRRKVPSK